MSIQRNRTVDFLYKGNQFWRKVFRGASWTNCTQKYIWGPPVRTTFKIFQNLTNLKIQHIYYLVFDCSNFRYNIKPTRKMAARKFSKISVIKKKLVFSIVWQSNKAFKNSYLSSVRLLWSGKYAELILTGKNCNPVNNN